MKLKETEDGSVPKKHYHRFSMIADEDFRESIKALCQRLKIKNQSAAIKEAVKFYKNEEA